MGIRRFIPTENGDREEISPTDVHGDSRKKIFEEIHVVIPTHGHVGLIPTLSVRRRCLEHVQPIKQEIS